MTSFTVDTDGDYDVTVLEPINDPAFPGTDDTGLIVYETSFDPANACTNLVGIGNEIAGSGLTVTLDDATNYVLVVFGVFGTEDDYEVRIQGPAATVVTVPQPVLTTELNGVRDYRVLALPTGGTYDDLLAPLWTQGFQNSDDPAGGCSAYDYAETAASFEGGYTCFTDQNATWQRGRGAYVYVYADDDLTTPTVIDGGFPKTLSVDDPGFADDGAPFTFPVAGDADPILTYTNNPGVPSYQEGWNLLGNPLTAGMDWDETVRGGGLTPTIYVLDPNYFGGDYRTWTANIGGDLPGGVVPAFQGFFAKAVAANPTLTVPVAAVVAPGPNVYGKDASSAPLRFELSLNGEPVSAAFVAAAPEAALGLDTQDAYRLTPAAYPRTVLSTHTVGDAEATPLALNALPAEATGEIEMALEVAAEGHGAGPLALTLAWSGALPEGWTAEIVDRELQTTVALTEGGTYAFEMDVLQGDAKARPAGLGLALGADAAPQAKSAGAAVTSGERFVLRVTPQSVTTGTDAPEAPSLAVSSVWPNPASRRAEIKVSVPSPEHVRVSVHDALGREVAVAYDAELAASADVALDLSPLAVGVYAVRVVGTSFQTVRSMTVVR
ncbi:T9SS type A sorting domain-containing protein [Rubricoccus marinus]|uniref:Secretion system C-terminal sorting domain-containing protein n=1 Tax=Rubricoccus marinus TaxID=716817 RepID=A0A259TX57_9BACT|nr:T9SS type A sorting domain-containing protein [Rubricoccus marinus]OZC02349.1 hypothetical protein BSZ36_04775 [Rubricoccus marinus]